MKNLCIITARGGSKRIPRKNIKPFMGKPIIAYSIESAINSNLFDVVMVSTDTGPFVTPEKMKEACNMLGTDIDASFTMVQYSYPIQRSLKINSEGYVEMNFPQYRSSRSQDLEKIYHDAGQFYFIKIPTLLCEKTLWCKHTAPLILSDLEVQDLDTETDWAIAEIKYQREHPQLDNIQ